MKIEKVRLQKYMAECGVASRRKSEELIAGGFVKVNGRRASIGDQVIPKRDLVTVHGKRLEHKHEMRYILLYKPRGYITTLSDEQDRRCVADLVKDIPERVYPVGRLDRESEGMLFLTNDGNFANVLTHPSKHVPKTYRVTVRPGITDEQLLRMQEGIVIDGRKTAPAEAHVVLKEEGRTVVEIVLHEGRNRQIRKMCEVLGLEVARLKRIAIGTVRLGMLQPGKWRELTTEEVRRLLSGKAAAGKNDGQTQGKRKSYAKNTARKRR